MWIDLLGYTREAVLAYQHSVTTRNAIGTLASIHNKFVRIATFRLKESLLEFVDPLPDEAYAALEATLAPDDQQQAVVIVPTRPTRLAVGEAVKITAIVPGQLEPVAVNFCWRLIGATSWQTVQMTHVARRTYDTLFTMPATADAGIEYRVEGTFASTPAPLVKVAPPAGSYLITC